MDRKRATSLMLALATGILLGMAVSGLQWYRSTSSDEARLNEPVPAPSNNPLFRERPAPDPVQEEAVPNEPDFNDDELLAGERDEALAQAQQERDQLQAQLTELLNWILSNVRGRYPLPEHLVSRLRLHAVTPDFTLDPDVVGLLKITPAEESILNEAFATTSSFLNEMETALMRVTQPHEDKVIVHVPSYGEEGDVIREDLYLALEAVLGADRFDRLIEVSGEHLESSFVKFGDESRTVVFEVVFQEGDNQPLLRIRDGRVAEDDNGKRFVTATEEVVAVLPDEYLRYLDWWIPTTSGEQVQ